MKPKTLYLASIISLILVGIFAVNFMRNANATELTLDAQLEANKEALKEFQTLSPAEQCIYLKLDDCDDL
jgi:uncharacterized membrane-anchored protein YhcB (DUF1043 family)